MTARLSDEAVAVLAARPEIIDIHDVRRLLDDALELVAEVQELRRGRRLAGPFEPVEGVEWCTVHQGVSCEDSDDHCNEFWSPDSPLDACHFVTLYIEVRS